MKRDIIRVIAVSMILLISIIIFKGYASISEREEKNISPSMRLKELNPEEVESIEIFRLESQKGESQRIRTSGPQNNKEVIQGILSLCKKAAKYKMPERGGLYASHYIFVAKLTNGQLIEIPYSSRIKNSPLGDLDSQELKEALYALVSGCKGSIIHFNNGKVVDVIPFETTMVGSESSTLARFMRLEKDGKLFLNLRLRKDRKVVMEDSKPIRYGQAQVFKYDGDGYMIVYIESPEIIDPD